MENYVTAREATGGNKIRLVPFACWITKATDTHSECVTFVAFPHQWLRKRAVVLLLVLVVVLWCCGVVPYCGAVLCCAVVWCHTVVLWCDGILWCCCAVVCCHTVVLWSYEDPKEKYEI